MAAHKSDAPNDHYASLGLEDGARVKRACERWPLLELVRRLGSARRTTVSSTTSGAPAAAAGAAWWEA